MASPWSGPGGMPGASTGIAPEDDPIRYGAEAALSWVDPRPTPYQRGEEFRSAYQKISEREASGEAEPGTGRLYLERNLEDVEKFAPELLPGGQFPDIPMSTQPPISSGAVAEIPGDAPPGVGAGMGGPEAPTGPSYTERLYNEASEIGRAIQELAPEYAEKQKATLNTMRGVHKEQMEFINDSIKDQKESFDEALKLRNDFEQTRNTLQEAQTRAAATTRAKLDGINSQIMNYEIDPNRSFKSVWQVVGAAVAAAAGAYAQGLSQGKVPNTALAIIDKAIDRDIHAQKMELGKLQTAADIQNNVYGRMLQEHGNERRAIAEARAAALGMAQLKLNQLKATTASGLKARSIQVMELRLQQDWNKAVMTAERASMTAAYNGKLREIDLLQEAGTTGTSSKLSVAQKIARVVPQFDNLKQIWNKVDFVDAMSYMTKFGTLFGTEGAVKGAAEVKAYIQARNTTVKEIVQIFEGSKPSDLDWKVMVELLPDYWSKKSYGDAVITSFQEFLKAKGGTGLKEGDIARWALQSGRMNYDDIKNASRDSIDKVKFDIGFKEE